jgi:hypothetical protein
MQTGRQAGRGCPDAAELLRPKCRSASGGGRRSPTASGPPPPARGRRCRSRPAAGTPTLPGVSRRTMKLRARLSPWMPLSSFPTARKRGSPAHARRKRKAAGMPAGQTARGAWPVDACEGRPLGAAALDRRPPNWRPRSLGPRAARRSWSGGRAELQGPVPSVKLRMACERGEAGSQIPGRRPRTHTHTHPSSAGSCCGSTAIGGRCAWAEGGPAEPGGF